jgi:hypothetical protein
MRLPLIVFASLALLAGCPKKYQGKTKPSSDTAWHDCRVSPDKRSPGTGSGTLKFTVKCTAKETLWIHDIEVVLYEGDKASNQGPKALLAEDEKIDLAKGASGERSGSYDVSTMEKPWVIKARILFGYPGGFSVDRMDSMEADMEAMDKDKRDNPTKFKIELSAAFE